MALKEIAIIGAGAAGMMCAATILEESKENLEIHLFEKNKAIGIKVALSGGGRCNVTTGIHDQRMLLEKYIRGSKFLKPTLSAFPPTKVMEWFENHGVPLKTETDLRVFPVSDIGQDIVDVFERIFKDSRIKIHYDESVKDITSNDSDTFLISTSKTNYEFDIAVLTTGGNAYRRTGSTGDGYHFAKALGHTITELGPSLNSFMTKEMWCKDLQGISFKNAKLEVGLKTGEKKSVTGPTLFTHFGISGPAVFALAAHTAFETISQESPLTISFIPKGHLYFDDWNTNLAKEIATNGAKKILSVISDFFPLRFALKLFELANINPNKKCAEITKEERKQLAHLLSGQLKLTLVMRRPGDEFVTAGGVDLNEIDPKTMRSKINPNLYFAGEIMDVDGLTGGFNLQASWAAGRSAGSAIIAKQ